MSTAGRASGQVPLTVWRRAAQTVPGMIGGVRRRVHRPHRILSGSFPDLVQRDFITNGPNRLWVTGLTMIPTGEGPLRLSAIRDAFSRRVVAWETSARADADLVLTSLEHVLASREVAPGELVHHADHGCPYTSLQRPITYVHAAGPRPTVPRGVFPASSPWSCLDTPPRARAAAPQGRSPAESRSWTADRAAHTPADDTTQVSDLLSSPRPAAGWCETCDRAGGKARPPADSRPHCCRRRCRPAPVEDGASVRGRLPRALSDRDDPAVVDAEVLRR
ncbi:DDE-type integrase/transposase/recombinase [Streptomyces albogriseolus]|uniref:DDE-type integrase/transposase/recombinase n=1 Tax=Streptomyces albogriseolus TaxID=1887 RepID=UPI0033B7C71A